MNNGFMKMYTSLEYHKLIRKILLQKILGWPH